MKELTTEQKAKAYDEAKARMSRAFNTNRCTIGFMNEIFPELKESKESENERIKFLIKSCVYASNITPEGREDIFAWLEKQGEQKSVNNVEPKFESGKWIVNKESKEVFYIRKNLANTYEIVDIEGNSYHVPHYTLEEDYDVWTIDNARDGDVLYYECHGTKNLIIVKSVGETKDHVEVHFWYDITCNVYEVWDGNLPYSNIASLYDAIPATKDQRNLLFQKMKEEGYEWDTEKKELKRIEEDVNGEDYGIDSLYHAQIILEKTLGKVDGYQSDDGMLEHKSAITAIKKLYEQKSDWSEEDEHRVKDTIYFLDTAKKHYASIVELNACIDWLKSLKDRVQPRREWSKEDEIVINKAESWLDTLCDYLKDSSSECIPDIKDIINKLKSLKQRID